jgi:DNA-binding transcriptional MerR regulator
MRERLYTVTQLAHDLGLTPRAIRFYEDKGLITPRRAGTTRVYTHRDRARMILIQRGKRLGFSLSEIRDYLDLYDADITQRAQLRHLLDAVTARLAKLQQQHEALEQSIAELSDIKAQAEAALAEQRAAESRAAD